MKQILFFALKEDLLSMLQLVESKNPLKYVHMGNYSASESKDNLSVFNSRIEIPDLGIATADSSAACKSYLACEQGTSINLRSLQGSIGGRICVDQLANPDSVVFTPGGSWSEEVVLNGRVGTASESQVSRSLMKRFDVAIKKTFSKVRAFYVGPKALTLLKLGERLAGAVQSPREFDLVPDSAES